MAPKKSTSLKMAWPTLVDQLPMIPGTNRWFPKGGQKIDTENPSWALLIADGSLTLTDPARKEGKTERKGTSK